MDLWMDLDGWIKITEVSIAIEVIITQFEARKNHEIPFHDFLLDD